MLQESQPEQGLTVRECLELYAGYYSAPRDIAETIALVGLQEKADTLGEVKYGDVDPVSAQRRIETREELGANRAFGEHL